MARTVTLLEWRTWARQLSDTENDPNVTDDELTALANRHIPAVYDALIEAGPPDFYASSTTITTSAAQITYPLEVDFRALLEVHVVESSVHRRPLRPMGSGQRGRHQAPTGAWDVEVDYIPAAPVLVDDGDTFDGVSGFEELVANMMARDVMIKRESDPSAVMSTIAMLEARVRTRSKNRDRGNPRRVTDLDEVYANEWPYAYGSSSRLSCYRLRAGNIEFYESAWVLP